jgi:cysteinyl-tRNA synthetase
MEDVLVRLLGALGYGVKRVMNLTDVGHLTSDADEGEDKLEVGARREGTTAWEVARKYEEHFMEDMEALKMKKPIYVRATDRIKEQIELIQRLESAGFIYVLEDGVYFDSAKFPTYGQLARLDIEGLQGGARVEMIDGKKSVTDFALWKFSPPGVKRDMEWESPWGVGFPGWHIECSAIILKELGEQIDIHAGGVDHISVHHSNEIAQSEAATGKTPFVKYWFHVEFLQVDGGKMSKSLGNVYTIQDLKKRGFDPLDYRFFTYSATYRAKQNFTWESLESSRTALRRLRLAIQEKADCTGPALDPEATEGELKTAADKFLSAMTDDLNLPASIPILHEVLNNERLTPTEKGSFIRFVDSILAIELDKNPDQEGDIPSKVKELAAKREKARSQKQWAESDSLRHEIEKLGYIVRDTPQGAVIEKSRDNL